MRFLLDTCTALWWWSGDARLSSAANAVLSDDRNEVLFHQISFLEITLKHSLGKLSLKELPGTLVSKALRAYRIGYRVLANRDIARMGHLPWHHRDPFDRLLIAHALEHGFTLVTSDAAFGPYGVPVLW